ncbi:hypothetical protein GCM10007859_16980 [Brevundimonas denitrificans]|uniref:histidine kinase n=1 Tax=Brevundimonas denitrificans TaxID=1443434 RepID=A0ABQ6BP74_9CAUL|nr:ATP-binding protein [Brevundimonas denitrificans]GLS01683.1 hypothetical protein GCM10007859_16980 [Brevundimonas denitrificans]
MITLPPTDREAHRVDMVRSFGLLDQIRSPLHDEICAHARSLAQTQSALIALVDSERAWFSGGANFEGEDTCRWSSFCTHVIAEPVEFLWVEDASKDFRFARIPRVRSSPHLRFYAGAPILVNGYAVGALCVFDAEPRPFDSVLSGQLSSLAKIVAEDLAARHRTQSIESALIASADALIDIDQAGFITYWSDGAERLFGFSSADAVGANINIIVPDDFKAAHNEGFARWRQSGVARTGRRMDLTACRKDGTPVEIELWMAVVHERGVPHIHANIRDISERKAHANALEVATTEAQAANEAKTSFLANMSHEFRTPLNGVIGVVDLLRQTSLSDHQRELTSIIRKSSDQLAQLVGDVLDLARIESGNLVLTEVNMSLPDVVESVRNICELAAHEKGLTLSVDLDSDATSPVIGDPLRITQVLNNLVSNAIKFTERGSISISVRRSEDDYRFEVSDTGIGFNDEQRGVIFGRFQQADVSITRRFGGTGLGLAISRDLVTRMGGAIDCYSEPGHGATFWVTLRLPQAAQTPADDAPPPVTPEGMGRVLVVDDNATNRRVAQLLLQAIGIEVATVDDGKQAVEAFVNEKFDVILMDMMMPVMDGVAATIAIRDIERQHGMLRTSIIMLTANNLPQHIEASLNAGADLHLPKPLSVSGLLQALSKMPEPTSHQQDAAAYR